MMVGFIIGVSTVIVGVGLIYAFLLYRMKKDKEAVDKGKKPIEELLEEVGG